MKVNKTTLILVLSSLGIFCAWGTAMAFPLQVATIPNIMYPEVMKNPGVYTYAHGMLFLFLTGIAGLLATISSNKFHWFKRFLDLFLSAGVLFLTFPFLLLGALMIKLTSKGPVIYRQERMGKNGEIFKIYKLRTMNLDAENGIGAVWATRNDPRITPIGLILRKARIDEIPQIFNVIKGEMSIVGPRPERPELVETLKTLVCDYEKRLAVKPGITGLAQIFNKYDENISDVRKKIKYDILYIKKMGWVIESRILVQTFLVALTGKGAR